MIIKGLFFFYGTFSITFVRKPHIRFYYSEVIFCYLIPKSIKQMKWLNDIMLIFECRYVKVEHAGTLMLVINCSKGTRISRLSFLRFSLSECITIMRYSQVLWKFLSCPGLFWIKTVCWSFLFLYNSFFSSCYFGDQGSISPCAGSIFAGIMEQME